jgi:KaiC/GvpD/RAD55 family RecA-like ATPase
LEQFFRDHDIAIHSQSKFSGGIKYILEECPFNSSHKHPDAAVFKMSNGALGFKCLHNSCQQYTWRDFRLHFDPEAYDKKEYYAHLQRQQYYAPPPPPPPIPADLPTPEDPAKGKKWLQMSDIKYINPAKIPYIPSGIVALDKKIMGLMMGDVTILTGLPSCGKTSLIGNLVLNVAQRGEKAALWSGEMQDFRVQSWIDQMAAGKNYVRAKEGYDNLYFAPKDVCDRVNEWLDGKLFLYNNEYGCKWNQLFQDIQEVVDQENIKLVILDNLMALDLTFQGEKNDKQTQFIKEIKDYAKRKNIHILLVAHPRKETSFQLLRPDSIAGTSDLGNLCDNLFIMHRVGRDFEKRAKGFFEQWQIEDWKRFSVVIEICKNRSFGVSDFIVGMYYEKESRRLKNEIAEHIVYGWQDEARVQQTLPLDDLPPDNDEFDKAQELDDLPF